jgi:iron complex outermembrane receptor protein
VRTLRGGVISLCVLVALRSAAQEPATEPSATAPAAQDRAAAPAAQEPSPAAAPQPTDEEPPPAAKAKKGVFTLGEVQVTAGKDEEPPTDTTLGQEELRLFDRQTVAQAATLAPGVSFAKGGKRNESMLYVRGLDIKHVPLFLDGIPIYVPYDGYPDLGRFMTYDLSEIVISKGFTSLLYGPNTMGGAINLVSRRPEKLYEGGFGVSYRTEETYDAYGNVGTNLGKGYLQAGGSFNWSNGFPLSNGFDPVATEGGGIRNNAFTRDWKVSAKAGWTPTASDEYALTYAYQNGKKGVPPYAGSQPPCTGRNPPAGCVNPSFWKWPYWRVHSLFLTTNTALGEKSYAKARAFYDVFQNSLWAFDDGTYSTMSRPSSFKSTYDDYTFGGSVEAGTSLLPHNTVKLAFHFKDDVHREVGNVGQPQTRTEARIFSAAVEDTLQVGEPISIVGGASFDYQKVIGAQTYDSNAGQIVHLARGDARGVNAQGAVFYALTDSARVYATVAWKSRLPSIKDLYSFRLGKALPNPYLDPERAITYELGGEKTSAHGIKAKVAGFFRDVKGYVLAVTVPDPQNPGSTLLQNQNIGKVRQVGAEVELSAPLAGYGEVGANYAFVHNENRTNDLKLIGIPAHKAFAYAQVLPLRAVSALRSLSVLASLEYDSQRYTTDDGIQVAGPFVVVNTKVGYEPYRDLIVEVGVSNLFDKNYGYDEGYPEPGRTYSLEARYRF